MSAVVIAEQIGKIAEKLGSTAEQIVNGYAVWYVADSIVFLFVFTGIAIAAYRWKPEDAIADIWPILKWPFVFLFILLAANQIPHLVAPKAIATHQLIQDIRGAK